MPSTLSASILAHAVRTMMSQPADSPIPVLFLYPMQRERFLEAGLIAVDDDGITRTTALAWDECLVPAHTECRLYAAIPTGPKRVGSDPIWGAPPGP